jgi:hypothetical protein
MVEQDPNVQESGVQDPIPYVTAEMAWEMSKRAAAEAREDALKEAQTQMQNNMSTQNNMSVQNIPQNNRDDYDDRRERKRRRRYDDEEEEEDLIGFSPKLVKQLQTTVGVFNTLKDFASNPMQKAIEDRIGGLAAGIIEQAFTGPRGPPPKRDMVDTLLNSQMAFGLGQGLGSRAPELVESLSRSFGREKAENMIEGMIGKYAGGDRRTIESGQSDRSQHSEPSNPSPGPQKSEDQSNIELLLSLDPNNPEHVAAYAESQGGISIDVARKMLMIHQDDIIKRMKSRGADTTIIESQRGSRVGQDNPSQHNETQPPVQQTYPSQQTYPPQQTRPIEQTFPVQQQPSQPNITNEDMQYMETDPGNISQNLKQPKQQEQEYAEYDDIGQQENNSSNQISNLSNDQQAEMMKVFAEDIGKVMGDVIGKIESLNNTVFSLQSELNDMKRQKISSPPLSNQNLEQVPMQEPKLAKDFFPDDFYRELDDKTSIQDLSPKNIMDTVDITKQDTFTRDVFPEKTQSIHDFENELEKETRLITQQIKKENIDKSENIDESPKIEVDTKIKEIEIIKKPNMSMVNKKKIIYSLNQKEENIQSKNNDNDINDNNNSPNNENNNPNNENNSPNNENNSPNNENDNNDKNENDNPNNENDNNGKNENDNNGKNENDNNGKNENDNNSENKAE